MTAEPGTEDELEAVIGTDATIRLIAAFGGQRFYVGREPEPDGLLVLVIGRRATLALHQHYFGNSLEVPVGHRWLLECRARRVAELTREGLSSATIGARMRLTERSVRRVQAKGKGHRQPKALMIAGSTDGA